MFCFLFHLSLIFKVLLQSLLFFIVLKVIFSFISLIFAVFILFYLLFETGSVNFVNKSFVKQKTNVKKRKEEEEEEEDNWVYLLLFRFEYTLKIYLYSVLSVYYLIVFKSFTSRGKKKHVFLILKSLPFC